ncbi:MAG: hypothetical protein MUO19_01770 [Dehalococcoidales bacterium]|nr:hypothetical protein [Dehalococcoidales bacterium]
MLVVWIRKADKNRQTTGESTEDKAARHNADMKAFRASHPDLNIIDARDIVTADGSLLAPVQGVKLAEYAKN